jgi:hypothetical protein
LCTKCQNDYLNNEGWLKQKMTRRIRRKRKRMRRRESSSSKYYRRK